jgi:hypothetical protein
LPGRTPGTEVVVGGEQQEADGFDYVEYVADAASLGIPEDLVMLARCVRTARPV